MENDEAKINLLARVARSAAKAASSTAPGAAPLGAASSGAVPSGASGTSSGAAPSGTDWPVSILSLCAASYGARPSDEATVPTGFDPLAVALFESIVEGAYLVAQADGVFDDDERKTFERVVSTACGGAVAPKQVHALVMDLEDQLAEDGIDARIKMLASPVQKRDHAREILRIAALLAQTSEDVSAVERDVLAKIAAACGLDGGEVDSAIADVHAALRSA
jgi:tellurite resistance protein